MNMNLMANVLTVSCPSFSKCVGLVQHCYMYGYLNLSLAQKEIFTPGSHPKEHVREAEVK